MGAAIPLLTIFLISATSRAVVFPWRRASMDEFTASGLAFSQPQPVYPPKAGTV